MNKLNANSIVLDAIFSDDISEEIISALLNNFDDLPLFSETDEEYIFIFDQTTSSTSNYSKIQFDRIRASGFIGVHEYLKKNVLDSEKSEFITLKNCRASEVNAKAKF